MQAESSMEKGMRSDPDAPVTPADGGPDCDYCGNKRYVLDKRNVLKPCPKCGVARQWRIKSVGVFSSASATASQQTLRNFRTVFDGAEVQVLKECLDEAEEFVGHPDGKWLVIWGERGSGKSHLCAGVQNELAKFEVPSLFITMPELLASLRQAMDLQSNTEQESYSGRMSVFKSVPVLILDDLGADARTGWSDSVAFEILDFRYRNRLPTMIVTNCPLDDKNAIDPRIASRMQDTKLSKVIKNSASDFRKRPADA